MYALQLKQNWEEERTQIVYLIQSLSSLEVDSKRLPVLHKTYLSKQLTNLYVAPLMLSLPICSSSLGLGP